MGRCDVTATVLLLLCVVGQCNGIGAFGGAKKKTPATTFQSWQRQACDEKQSKQNNGRYTCTPEGQLQCHEGWTGDMCNVPICKKGCDPMNGYCNAPGECRCRLGFGGEFCERCALLPGCQHGTCNKSFECICKPGWTGIFCSQATCRAGCHSNRGYCDVPGECKCRLGWSGENCTECQVVPGCKNGYCQKPLDCLCKPGWTGLLCQTPICRKNCSIEHGYCESPDQCRCRVGYVGANCDECFPYPGCRHGYCRKPWECRCQEGWTGFLCDERMITSSSSCNETESPCLNGGTCLSEGSKDSTCICPSGFSGPRCNGTHQHDSSMVHRRLPITKESNSSAATPEPHHLLYNIATSTYQGRNVSLASFVDQFPPVRRRIN